MSTDRKRGRPPIHAKPMALTVPLRLPPDLLGDVDALVALRKDGATRNQVLRELIVAGLAVSRKGKR